MITLNKYNHDAQFDISQEIKTLNMNEICATAGWAAQQKTLTIT